MVVTVYEFGDFTLDCGRFELCRNGRTIPLERKPMELLILLAERKGQLVTRTEIAERLWEQEVFVDTEHGINTAIRKIRQVLRDDPERPRFVLTVMGKGYRFIAPLTAIQSQPAEVTLSAAPAVDSTSPEAPLAARLFAEAIPGLSAQSAVPTLVRPRRRIWLWVPICAAVFLVLAGGFWYAMRPLPRLRVTGYKQITHDGHVKFLTGTDGTRLYFNRLNASPTIGEVAVDGGDTADVPVNLPQPAVADVAKDGSSILVGSNDGNQFTLWRMQTPGGTLRRVAGNDIVQNINSVALSPDDGFVAFITEEGDLYVMRDDGTQIRSLAHPPGAASPPLGDDVTWSPNGRRIRFTWNHRFWEIGNDGSGLHRLLPGWRAAAWQCCGRWTPDGRFFIFLLRDTFSNPFFSFGQLWALDERYKPFRSAARRPTQLTFGPMRWATPIPSKDGREVFARGVVLRGELVRYDARSKEFRPMFRGISAEGVEYSPDGKSVAYVTFPEGILWRANWDGSDPVQLTRSPLYPMNPHWSPDGTKILFFDVGFGTKSHNYTISAQGGAPVQILVKDDRGEQSDPTWSPDGRKIAFAGGGINSGPSTNVRILDLSNHRTTKISGSDGLWSPRWSPTGRYIAALTTTSSLAVFNFNTQRWSVLEQGGCGYPTWSRDGRSIYFLRTADHPGLYRVPVSGGKTQQLVDLTGFRFNGVVGVWMGLDPKGTPMMIRDIGTDDFYALTLDQK
ncbi:MAG: winged helix-turn-helix domain-containing protein [Acidobacteriaceae bacterium]